MVFRPAAAFSLFFFFGGTWIWIQGFPLAKQVLYCLSHTSSPICSGYFGDEVSWSICLGWPRAMILLISASQVARITDMSYHAWHLFHLCTFEDCARVWPWISPKGPCPKTVALLGAGGIFRRQSLEEEVSSLRVCPGRSYWGLTFSSFCCLCFPAARSHLDELWLYRPSLTGSSNHGPTPLKL
jgi:hypothetical protein